MSRCADLEGHHDSVPVPFICWDTEDAEDLLVDLGIGHFDISGYYHDDNEALSPEDEFLDVPADEGDGIRNTR